MMPADEGAYFVMVEADLALGHLESLLDMVAMSSDTVQARAIERRIGGGEEVPRLPSIERLHNEEHLLTRRPSVTLGFDASAECEYLDGPLFTVADFDALPFVERAAALAMCDRAPLLGAALPIRGTTDVRGSDGLDRLALQPADEPFEIDLEMGLLLGPSDEWFISINETRKRFGHRREHSG